MIAMAVQFGDGPEFAARCPIAPVPDGYRPWTDADGPVPEALTKRAVALAGDPGISLGATESYPLPGVVALMRVEPRIWRRGAQDSLIEGCFRSTVLFLPSGAAAGAGITPPSESDRTAKIVGVLTAISLVVGTVATITHWKRAG